MAVKHFYIVTCDGPCGTALDKTSGKMPDGWKRLQLGVLAPKTGVPNPAIFSIVLCEKCQDTITKLMNDHGFVTTLSPAQQAKVDGDEI